MVNPLTGVRRNKQNVTVVRCKVEHMEDGKIIMVDMELWQFVVRNNLLVPEKPYTTMKKQASMAEELENYSNFYRRETLRRWAQYLDHEIKKSGIVSNQSQIEPETAKYGKRFTVSRQRISQVLAARNPDIVMKDLSLMSVESVLGIAAALNLPREKALAEAGYRTDFGAVSRTDIANELVAAFNKMSNAKQKLTLSIAQAILDVQDNEDSLPLTDEQRRILGWYDNLDAVNRTILTTLMRPGGGHAAPQLEANSKITPTFRELTTTQAKAGAQAQPVPQRAKGFSTSPPVKVYTAEELETIFPDLPEETRTKLEEVLKEGGVRVKSNNDNGTEKVPTGS